MLTQPTKRPLKIYFWIGLADLRLAQTPNPKRMVLPITGRAFVSQGTAVGGGGGHGTPARHAHIFKIKSQYLSVGGGTSTTELDVVCEVCEVELFVILIACTGTDSKPRLISVPPDRALCDKFN